MAAMIKTTFSIQKDLFDQAEALARQLDISISRLFAMAVEDFFQDAAPAAEPGAGRRQIRQGDIYWISPALPGGKEASIAHPHVVIQDDVLNHSRLSTVVVCALTSNLRRAKAPGNVPLEAGEANLPRQSVVEVTKVSAVDKKQVGAFIGSLGRQRVDQILAGLRFVQAMADRGEIEDMA